jgi:hypothetical protein
MKPEKESALLRTIVITTLILLAAALRIAPHPWNFTPLGAMALFSGAMLRGRRMAFVLPLVALFAGDLFIGFHKLMPVVYASFFLSVIIGRFVSEKRSIVRIGGATLVGAVQFFLLTNLAVWAFEDTYPHTLTGLGACYLAGLPFFWNTLAGDALYVALFFGGFALAERLVPDLRRAASAPVP